MAQVRDADTQAKLGPMVMPLPLPCSLGANHAKQVDPLLASRVSGPSRQSQVWVRQRSCSPAPRAYEIPVTYTHRSFSPVRVRRQEFAPYPLRQYGPLEQYPGQFQRRAAILGGHIGAHLPPPAFAFSPQPGGRASVQTQPQPQQVCGAGGSSFNMPPLMPSRAEPVAQLPGSSFAVSPGPTGFFASPQARPQEQRFGSPLRAAQCGSSLLALSPTRPQERASSPARTLSSTRGSLNVQGQPSVSSIANTVSTVATMRISTPTILTAASVATAPMQHAGVPCAQPWPYPCIGQKAPLHSNGTGTDVSTSDAWKEVENLTAALAKRDAQIQSLEKELQRNTALVVERDGQIADLERQNIELKQLAAQMQQQQAQQFNTQVQQAQQLSAQVQQLSSMQVHQTVAAKLAQEAEHVQHQQLLAEQMQHQQSLQQPQQQQHQQQQPQQQQHLHQQDQYQHLQHLQQQEQHQHLQHLQQQEQQQLLQLTAQKEHLSQQKAQLWQQGEAHQVALSQLEPQGVVQQEDSLPQERPHGRAQQQRQAQQQQQRFAQEQQQRQAQEQQQRQAHQQQQRPSPQRGVDSNGPAERPTPKRTPARSPAAAGRRPAAERTGGRATTTRPSPPPGRRGSPDSIHMDSERANSATQSAEGDELDEVDRIIVQYLEERPDLEVEVEKLKKGWYMFGNPIGRKGYVKLSGDNTRAVVRIGGGYQDLGRFFDSYR